MAFYERPKERVLLVLSLPVRIPLLRTVYGVVQFRDPWRPIGTNEGADLPGLQLHVMLQ